MQLQILYLSQQNNYLVYVILPNLSWNWHKNALVKLNMSSMTTMWTLDVDRSFNSMPLNIGWLNKKRILVKVRWNHSANTFN